MPKINRYWNSDPDSLVEYKRPETYDLCKSCECINQLLWKEKRLKRALWLAHAYKAKFKRWWLHLALDCEASAIRPDTKTINRIKMKIGNCEKSERKCRAKAEEYKEKKAEKFNGVK